MSNTTTLIKARRRVSRLLGKGGNATIYPLVTTYLYKPETLTVKQLWKLATLKTQENDFHQNYLISLWQTPNLRKKILDELAKENGSAKEAWELMSYCYALKPIEVKSALTHLLQHHTDSLFNNPSFSTAILEESLKNRPSISEPSITLVNFALKQNALFAQSTLMHIGSIDDEHSALQNTLLTRIKENEVNRGGTKKFIAWAEHPLRRVERALFHILGRNYFTQLIGPVPPDKSFIKKVKNALSAPTEIISAKTIPETTLTAISIDDAIIESSPTPNKKETFIPSTQTPTENLSPPSGSTSNILAMIAPTQENNPNKKPVITPPIKQFLLDPALTNKLQPTNGILRMVWNAVPKLLALKKPVQMATPLKKENTDQPKAITVTENIVETPPENVIAFPSQNTTSHNENLPSPIHTNSLPLNEESPALHSPSENSPVLHSPGENSPVLHSPSENSPILHSPGENSPTLYSPGGSPTLASPSSPVAPPSLKVMPDTDISLEKAGKEIMGALIAGNHLFVIPQQDAHGNTTTSTIAMPKQKVNAAKALINKAKQRHKENDKENARPPNVAKAFSTDMDQRYNFDSPVRRRPMRKKDSPAPPRCRKQLFEKKG